METAGSPSPRLLAPHAAPPLPPPPPQPASSYERSQAPARSSKACDTCRARKTKCIYEGAACRTCLELKIACKQDKPRKRRGPVNRFVAAQSTSPGQCQASFDSGNSVSPAVITTSGLDRLAPLHVVEQIIDIWFDQIHSVAPILYRRSFLTRLRAGQASQDGIFTALVVSICAATIASLRRKSSQDYGTLSPERCWAVVEEMQLQKQTQTFTLEWCQMKYNLGSSQYLIDDMQNFRNMSEAVSGIRYLIHYEMSQMDTISQELLKRLYWLVFAAGCSSDLKGLPYVGLFTAQDNVVAMTPLELSDDELDHAQNPDPHGKWHGNEKSYIPGLNYLSKLFLLWHQSQQESPPTITRLQHYMNLVQRALDYLPPELIWRGGLSRSLQSNFGTDVQTANLYITQLHIQSNILEQICHISNSAAAGQDIPSGTMVNRHSIVEDLLEILYHMPQEALEANGNSLIPKIRDIGSALFHDTRTGREQGLSINASENLKRLLTKLENLDVQSQFYLEMRPLSTII